MMVRRMKMAVKMKQILYLTSLFPPKKRYFFNYFVKTNTSQLFLLMIMYLYFYF